MVRCPARPADHPNLGDSRRAPRASRNRRPPRGPCHHEPVEPNRYRITLKIIGFTIGADRLMCTAADVLLVDGLPLPQFLASLPPALLPEAHHPVTLTDPADFDVTAEHLTCTAADVTLTLDLNLSQLTAPRAEGSAEQRPAPGTPWSPVTDDAGAVIAYSTAAEPGALAAM